MLFVAASLGLIGLFAMSSLWGRVRGTTLVAPWCWALASGIVLLAVVFPGTNEPLLNYVSAVTTLLPAAGIYGAKRPQDRGWQWIVVALLVMLLWPAGESWLLEQRFDLAAQPLRSWFLIVLLAVQWGNWSITANAGPVTLLTAAQVTMFWPQLPWGTGEADTPAWLLGASLIALVPWWLAWNLSLAKQFIASSDETAFPSPSELAAWRFFRAAYGVVWALRAMERINEVGKLRQWPWRWSWSGPVTNAAPQSDLQVEIPRLEDALDHAAWKQLWQNIFRRFLDTSLFPSEETSTPD